MYESLMCLPYFQGMSKDDITSILDKVKLEFTHYNEGELIVSQGTPCNNLMTLMRGTVVSHCTSPGGEYTLTEEHKGHFTFEPYSLFGRSPFYCRSYYAKSDCDILTIEKSYLFKEFAKYEIFLMNILNQISQRAQQKSAQIWGQRPLTLPEKIIEFLVVRVDNIEGCKILQTKMEDLAAIIGETRINVSRTLNAFREKGVIELRRKEIIIPSFKDFIETKEAIATPKKRV
jgi:CRP-like cAMP-binding protein